MAAPQPEKLLVYTLLPMSVRIMMDYVIGGFMGPVRHVGMSYDMCGMQWSASAQGVRQKGAWRERGACLARLPMGLAHIGNTRAFAPDSIVHHAPLLPRPRPSAPGRLRTT